MVPAEGKMRTERWTRSPCLRQKPKGTGHRGRSMRLQAPIRRFLREYELRPDSFFSAEHHAVRAAIAALST